METRSSVSRSLHTNRDLEKLEPYEGKPSCTVLRGEEGSNALDLPDQEDNNAATASTVQSTMPGNLNVCMNLVVLFIV